MGVTIAVSMVVFVVGAMFGCWAERRADRRYHQRIADYRNDHGPLR